MFRPQANDFQFTTNNASGIIPGQQGAVTAEQLENLNQTVGDLGIQAGPNGQQKWWQSILFDRPTVTGEGMWQRGGVNLEGLGSIMGGIGSLAQIYSSLKAIGVAEDNLDFQRDAFGKNLSNQRQSYNTALEDRTRARMHTEGKTSADVDAYLAKHSL